MYSHLKAHSYWKCIDCQWHSLMIVVWWCEQVNRAVHSNVGYSLLRCRHRKLNSHVHTAVCYLEMCVGSHWGNSRDWKLHRNLIYKGREFSGLVLPYCIYFASRFHHMVGSMSFSFFTYLAFGKPWWVG